MAAIDLPFAASASLRRPPTTGELADGYGCGDADLGLFNWIAWWGLGQIDQAIVDAGLTPDDALLTGLSKVIRRRVGWRGMVLFTSSGTFTPATYSLTTDDRLLVFAWGAGGGGSSIAGTWGGAGGGGGLGIKSTDCPASPTTVTIGAGGAGTNGGGAGGNGGTTSFGAIVSATGGIGGSTGGSAGGAGSGGDVNMTGGQGGDIINDVLASAVGGAAPFMGGSTINATSGNWPIGAGGWARSNGPDAASGNSGAVLVIY